MSLEVLSPPQARDATVKASLLFLEPSRNRPSVSFTYENASSVASEIYAPRTVLIRDGRLQAPELDVEGFELARHATTLDFSSETALAAGREEAAALVADATGAARVHVFDHTIRRRVAGAPRQPSTRVHVDYTAGSAQQRVRDLLGSEAEALLSRRVAFINVWRPIRHPAQDWPLALCDARSVDPADLIATDIVYPDRKGEIYGLVHNPAQRWFYVPDIRLDEALLLKCYDSSAGVARFTPHTAFENPLTPPGAPPRESIEFRTIAFF